MEEGLSTDVKGMTYASRDINAARDTLTNHSTVRLGGSYKNGVWRLYEPGNSGIVVSRVPTSLVGNLGKEVPYGGWYSLGKLASTEIKMTSEGVQVFNKFMVRPPLK